MLTLAIGFVSGILFAVIGKLAWPDFVGPFWMGLLGILGFIAVSLPLNLWVKKRQEALFREIQAMIEENQQALRRKITQIQNKMMSSTKGVQRQIEKQQQEGIEKAIAALDRADCLKKWNVLAERQTNTLRGQLAYQIQDFELADRALAKSLNMDPLTVCMKMARFCKKGEMEAVDKLFKKMKRRFKDENGAILYGLYSWILLKENRLDEAIDVLLAGKDKYDSDVLRKNWEHLVNGRERQFSNAGFGDLWYSLHLETPKPVRVKQRRSGKLR